MQLILGRGNCDECGGVGNRAVWEINLNNGYYKFYLCEHHLAKLARSIGILFDYDTNTTSATKA